MFYIGDFYTPWYNIDSPKDDGIDEERLSELGKVHYTICNNPSFFMVTSKL